MINLLNMLKLIYNFTSSGGSGNFSTACVSICDEGWAVQEDQDQNK